MPAYTAFELTASSPDMFHGVGENARMRERREKVKKKKKKKQQVKTAINCMTINCMTKGYLLLSCLLLPLVPFFALKLPHNDVPSV